MKLIVVFTILFGSICINAQVPKVSAGTIHHYDSFASKYVTSRNIDVWLPEGYTATKKYKVLYMHDGQMLFDSTITWNGTAWEVDEAMSKLKINNVIVVGIWNGGKTRHADYFPQKPFESLSKKEQDSVYSSKRLDGSSIFNNHLVQSDNYLRFIVKELKPFIDKKYRTYTNAANTFIMGSSMGGLISIYALCEYPTVFGAAACMSTHWPGIFTTTNNPIPNAFVQYLKTHLPNPKTHSIYFDYGTLTLDAIYAPLQNEVDKVLHEKGYNEKNWITKEFIGMDHSEKSWRKRLPTPLLFLFKRSLLQLF